MSLLILMAVFVVPLLAQPTPSPATGPIADVNGPGQSVARPAPQCPRTIACTYQERTFLPDSYRVQSLEVCGANCTTQYWVSNSGDGQQVLALDPVRGGAVVAVAQSATSDMHPPVRVVAPGFGANDPACCPSGFTDTTYTWDADSNALVAGQATVTASGDFPGWDGVRQELQAEGWTLAGV